MLIWLMIMAGVVFLDQLSKWLTVINLDFGESFPLIENVFHFTYVRNTGAAFSIFNEPDERWIFMSISTVALVALSIYLWFNRKKGALLCVALSFIIGGGIGNMIDRCLLKYVIDMLDFRLINFAVFNVADSFVCIGVGLFAFAVLREEIQAMKKEKAAKLAAQGEETPAESDENEQNDTDLNN